MSNRERIIKTIVPFCFLAFVIIANSIFMFVKGRYYVDSDIASNLIAADLFMKEGVIISKNWFYSTELATAQTHLLRIGLLIFKNNWVYALAITNTIILVFTAISLVGFARTVELEMSSSIWLSAIALSPLSYWYMVMADFPGYYNANIMLTFFALILFVKWCKCDSIIAKSNVTLILGNIGLAFLCGVFGEKYLTFPYAPLVASSIILGIMFFHDSENELSISISNRYVRIVIISIVVFGAFVIGYLLKSVYLQRNYVFENHSDTAWGYIDINELLKSFGELLCLYGFQNDPNQNNMVSNRIPPKLFSINGIACVFGIIVASILVISTIRTVKIIKQLCLWEQFVIILFCSTVLIDAIVFRWTQGHDVGSVYWVLMAPLGLFVIQIEIRTEDFRFDGTRNVVLAILIAMLSFCSVCTVTDYQKNPSNGKPHMVNIANWLVQNGYKKGYGTFWNSNVLTMLTNGDVEMWGVWGFDSLQIQEWLQKTDHVTAPSDDKVFAIIGPSDEIDRDVFLQYMNVEPGIPEIVYTDDQGYIIVEYK